MSAGLRDLPPDQQRTATCMLAVVSSQRGVTDSKLRFSTVEAPGTSSKSTLHIFIDYIYHHRGAVAPRVHPDEIDVTGEVITKKGGLGLGGLTSEQAPDLNDNDDGLLEIAQGWDRTCGVTMAVITD